MDYNQIALFVSIVEAGSLSEASRRLNTAKSNLSRALTNLEKTLGTQLIYRNTRNFVTTDAGLNLYQQCKEHLMDIKLATENIKQDETALKGKFTITMAVDVAHTIMPAIVADFAKAYPKLEIEIRGEDRMVDLVKEGVDLALRMGKLADSSLKALKISDISLIWVAGQNYVQTHSKIKKLEQLSEHRIITFNKKLENVTLLRKGSKKQRIKLKSSLLVNNPLLAKSMVLLGQGVALLPDVICYDELKSGQMVRILPELTSEPSMFHYVWPAHVSESPKVRAFIDFTQDSIKKYFISSVET